MRKQTSRAAARTRLSVVTVGLAAALAGPAATAGAVTPAGVVSAPLRGVDDPAAIDGRYIVVLKTPPSHGDRAQVALDAAVDRVEDAGADVTREYEDALTGYAATMSDDELAAARRDPNVAYVEADRLISIQGSRSPASWGQDRIDARTGLDNRIGTDGDGTGVTAFVIDTGVHANRADFGGRVVAGYTAVNDGRGTDDCAGHGTHVAGTIGSSTYGIAPGVTLVPVRVLGCDGKGSTSGVIAGVNWVTAQRKAASVANMSLGGPALSALDNAVTASIAAGVTYAVAAGNSNTNACRDSPARVPGAITVGASTRSDTAAAFSSWGACVDLYAPGQGIISASRGDSGSATMSGTSMASPHVAGAAALYLQAHPGSAPAAVASGLLADATPNVLTGIRSDTPNRLLHVPSGGAPPVTPTPTPTTPTTEPPGSTPPVTTEAPPPTAPPVTPPISRGCAATFTLDNAWSGGFQGTVTVAAGSVAIGLWRATFALPAGVTVGQVWGGTLTASGAQAVVSNLAWNGSLAAGATTTFGFVGSGPAPAGAIPVVCAAG